MLYLLAGTQGVSLVAIVWLAYKALAAQPAIRDAMRQAEANSKAQLVAEQSLLTVSNERDQLRSRVASAEAERVKAVGTYEACVLSLDAMTSANGEAHVSTIRNAATDADALAALQSIVRSHVPAMPGAVVAPSAPAGDPGK